MVGFHVIEWISRWFMHRLFVISLTVALVNMGQLLDAKPAPQRRHLHWLFCWLGLHKSISHSFTLGSIGTTGDDWN